jgi:hypothetical protein
MDNNGGQNDHTEDGYPIKPSITCFICEAQGKATYNKTKKKQEEKGKDPTTFFHVGKATFQVQTG